MFTKSLLAVTLFAAIGVQATPLSYKTQTAHAKTNCTKVSGEKEPRCHELTVAYPQTGDKTLDAWALAAIRKSVGAKDLSANGLKKFLTRSKDVAETNKENRTLRQGEYPCFLDYIHTLELEGQNAAIRGVRHGRMGIHLRRTRQRQPRFHRIETRRSQNQTR